MEKTRDRSQSMAMTPVNREGLTLDELGMKVLGHDVTHLDTEELEIAARLLLAELSHRFGKVNVSSSGPTPYYYAMGILNDNPHAAGLAMNDRLIRYAYERYGMKTAKMVYKFFAPCRLNPEITIASMAKRGGWKEHDENQNCVELSERG